MRRKNIKISSDSESIKFLINADEKFITLYNIVGELSYKLENDPYAFIIQTIIGQMLSNKVAEIIIGRLINICDSGRIEIESVKKISIKKLRSIGISQRKAQCILDFTNKYDKKEYGIKHFSSLSDNEIIKNITSFKGLGIWSAKMFLIFVLGRENILPYEDTAFIQAFIWYNSLNCNPSKEEIIKICEKWSPYTSIAVRYLYKALDNGLTKNELKLYCLNDKVDKYTNM
jgi:DNA-3-methyladenine glycosylase II